MEKYFLHRWTCSKESRHRIRNYDRVVLDFRLAERLSAFFECSDDREGEADDFGLFADRRFGRAVKLLRQLFCDYADFVARLFVLFVEKAPRENLQIAHDFVFGECAEYEDVLLLSVADADAVVEGKKRRGRDNAGDLFADYADVIYGQGIKRPHADSGVGVLGGNHVRADGLDLVQDVLAAGETDGHHQDECGRADDHAERG